MRIKLLLSNMLALRGFFYVYGPFWFKCSIFLYLCCSFMDVFWFTVSLQWSHHSLSWCTRNSTMCAQPETKTLKSISDSAIVPFRRIHSRELKCEMCDANFTVSMIVSIPGYFSECKHIIVLFIILVLKNSAPPTRAYYLSWQSTEELAQTSVQTLTTNWLLDLLKIDRAVPILSWFNSLRFFKASFSYMRFGLINFRT